VKVRWWGIFQDFSGAGLKFDSKAVRLGTVSARRANFPSNGLGRTLFPPLVKTLVP